MMTMTHLNFTQFALFPQAHFANVHEVVVFDFIYGNCLHLLKLMFALNICSRFVDRGSVNLTEFYYFCTHLKVNARAMCLRTLYFIIAMCSYQS